MELNFMLCVEAITVSELELLCYVQACSEFFPFIFQVLTRRRHKIYLCICKQLLQHSYPIIGHFF
jgi:hypothetical protein